MMEQHAALAKLLSSEMAVELSPSLSLHELRDLLGTHINRMIQANPSRLFAILYRVDVSEQKVREIMHGSHSDSGILIAELVIERQLQKLASREEYRGKTGGNEEEW